MALTVTSNTTSVLNMNSTTDGGGTWTANGGGNPAIDTDIFVDTASINSKISATRGGYQVTSSTPRDFDDAGTRKGMVAFWASTQSNLSDTTNTGGICIRIGSSSSAYGEWQVATKTGAGGVLAYPGGFQRFVVDLTTTPNTTVGSPNYAAVVYWSILFDITNTVAGNIKNCWIDRLDILTAADIAAGTAACTVSGTTTTAGSLFSEITNHATNTPQAFVSRVGGVYALNQPIQIGTTSGTNTFTSKNESCVWQAHKVNDGFFFLNFVGGSGTDTFTFGTKSGSGTSAVGIDPTTITSASPRWSLTASGTDIDTFQMYGPTFSKMTNCSFGTATTALGTAGTTYESTSTTLADLSGELTLNIGAATREENANRIFTSTNARAALNLIDSTIIDVSDWQIINSKGFENSGTAATRTVTGHSFINAAANKPYVSVTDSASAIWNLNNPNNGSGSRPSVTDQTELAFDGNSNGQVKENYVVTWSVKTPDGTAINAARVKILESAPSAIIANQDSSDSNGAVASTYLRALYVPSGASTLTTTTHTPQAFKTYKYGYLPSVSSATIDQPVTNNVAMLTDTFQAQATQATAITLGDTTNNVQIIDDRTATDSILIIKYTAGANTLTAGQTIKSSGSGTWRGVVKQIIEGNSTAGTIVVEYSSGVIFSDSAGTLDNVPSSGTWTATYTTSSVKRFAMGIDASTLTPQQLYDYVNAKLANTTLDTSKNFDDIVVWGKASEGIPIQGIGSKFKTVRNDATSQQGWVLWNLGGAALGDISSYMANDGTIFTPAATVTLEVNGVKTGSEPSNYVRVRIAAASGGPLSEGTEIMNTQATTSYGSQGYYKATASFNYTSDQPITVRARYRGYLPFETTGTITSTGLTVTAVWQSDPNFV